MDGDTRSFPRDSIRVSDADRDRAVTELSEHFQTGRLTQDEFEDRSGQALQARTGGDLSSLFTDLPSRPAIAEPQVPEPAPVPVQHRRRPLPLILPIVVAVFIVANIAGHGQGHTFGWLIPLLIMALIFTRMIRRGRWPR
jgi:hypothetical protein